MRTLVGSPPGAVADDRYDLRRRLDEPIPIAVYFPVFVLASFHLQIGPNVWIVNRDDDQFDVYPKESILR